MTHSIKNKLTLLVPAFAVLIIIMAALYVAHHPISFLHLDLPGSNSSQLTGVIHFRMTV